jgi:hypothetical protein
MSSRRLLPEAAYDFFTHDGRDGEMGPDRDTLVEAQADARRIRKGLVSWKRCVITLEWSMSEKKIARLLRATRLKGTDK